MATVVGTISVAAAFIAALLLLYSVDQPIHSTVQLTKARTHHMRTVRELGMWAAIVALLGAYLTAFLT